MFTGSDNQWNDLQFTYRKSLVGNVLLANGYGLHNFNYIASQLAN